jgi:hypothetical protein
VERVEYSERGCARPGQRVKLHEPWRSFLRAVDKGLSGPTEVHCFGGFVIAELYGLSRSTADVDVFEARGATNLKQLADVGGRGTPLAKQHRVYLDIVTVALVPDDYDKRLIDFSPDVFANLRLKAFERHDLALAKLGRNQDHDREDVKRLAMGPGLDIEVLRDRYKRELRYQFGNPEHEDLSLDLWCEMITEVQAESQKATTARPL